MHLDQNSWPNAFPPLQAISEHARKSLAQVPVQNLAKGSILFHPGDNAAGFVIVLSGRIEVHLTGASGREILLYVVDPGQSCVQTTLGLMAHEPYSGEAVVVSAARVALVPRSLFLTLIGEDAGFRGFVFAALGRRMQDVTRLLEQVAFASIESRLAAALLELSVDNLVHATQAELAARIGSAREVVTRRLDAFQRAGWVETDRGTVRILDRRSLNHAATNV